MHDDSFLPEVLDLKVLCQYTLLDHYPVEFSMVAQPVDSFRRHLSKLPLCFNSLFLSHDIFDGYMQQLLDQFASFLPDHGFCLYDLLISNIQRVARQYGAHHASLRHRRLDAVEYMLGCTLSSLDNFLAILIYWLPPSF